MCSCVTWKQINPNPIQAGLFLRERVSVTEGGGGGLIPLGLINPFTLALSTPKIAVRVSKDKNTI